MHQHSMYVYILPFLFVYDAILLIIMPFPRNKYYLYLYSSTQLAYITTPCLLRQSLSGCLSDVDATYSYMHSDAFPPLQLIIVTNTI